jgi:hypothetical protein
MVNQKLIGPPQRGKTDGTKLDFAIFVAVAGKAANHDGNFGISIVNAEIGRTGGRLEVGNKSIHDFDMAYAFDRYNALWSVREHLTAS